MGPQETRESGRNCNGWLEFVNRFKLPTARYRHDAVFVPTAFTFRDLKVWQQGIELVEVCYRLTATFPRDELYGLTSQLRRAVVSIPSNVAEGHGRRTTRAYRHHVSIAIGSHAEFATCLELASRLRFVSSADLDRVVTLSDSVGRLLYGLHRALARRISDRPPHPNL